MNVRHGKGVWCNTTMASTSAVQALAHCNAAMNDELLAMLRDELSGEEQELFLTGFQAYLQYDPKRDFVVSLDDVY